MNEDKSKERVIITVRASEFVEDEEGGHFIHYDVEEDITEHADRPENLCKLCGFDAYPKCLEHCTVGKFKNKSRE